MLGIKKKLKKSLTTRTPQSRLRISSPQRALPFEADPRRVKARAEAAAVPGEVEKAKVEVKDNTNLHQQAKEVVSIRDEDPLPWK